MTEQWRWKPELGRWRLTEHGYPADPERVAISTASVAEGDSYEYWRDLAFSDFEPDSMAREDVRSFQARARGLCWQGADFFLTQSSALSGSRQVRHIERDGMNDLSIGLVLKGERRSQQEDDDAVTVRAGGLFVYDASRPSRVAWSQHKGIFLVVRRPDVEALVGTVPDASVTMRRLARSSMRHVLADQLRMLANHADYLTPREQAYLLGQTVEIALFALANSGEDEGVAPASESMLFHAALRYIELNLADPNLDAQRIARAVNCSRATLYRAFAAQGLGVAETIRDIRLDRARTLLEQAPTDQSVADIAVACGIYDTANFSRQFRRRFGFAPSEMRRASR